MLLRIHKKTVTSTTSSMVQPASARMALGLRKAWRACSSKSGSGEPSSRRVFIDWVVALMAQQAPAIQPPRAPAPAPA
nr:hypothetical protein [Pseudoxanthomonas sp.]